MTWSFHTEPVLRATLGWVDRFSLEEVGPSECLIKAPRDSGDPLGNDLVKPLQREPMLGMADSLTKVHKITVARRFLKQYEPAPGWFPTRYTIEMRAGAFEKHRDGLQRHGISC